MSSLSASDVIRIWERAEGQHRAEQALTILATAFPDATVEQLAELTIGKRDRLLFQVRQSNFGPEIHGFVECPKCEEPLEFLQDITALCDDPAPDSDYCCVTIAPFDVRVRFPNSRDLLSITHCDGLQTARHLLVDRCVQEIRREGSPIGFDELPEDVMHQVSMRLAERDPMQDVRFEFACPACREPWQSVFDVVAFLSSELFVYAKRLLRDVHTLAMAYGWRETDVLAMSNRRRQFYLELVAK